MNRPIVPDFTPVTPAAFRDHMDTCPACAGPFDSWCPAGKDLLARLTEQTRRQGEVEPRRQSWELIRAGWRFFPQSDHAEIMSWYWRSPPKRAGSDGRLYRSTNQAWRAMMKACGNLPAGPPEAPQ